MDSLNNTAEQDSVNASDNINPDSEHYSHAMVDTIFADTLSRGMQNAITSQQNAQMASSTSITNACARILQARASSPVTAPIEAPTKNEATKKSVPTNLTPLLQDAPEKVSQSHGGKFHLSSVTPSDEADTLTAPEPENKTPPEKEDSALTFSKKSLYLTLGGLALLLIAGVGYYLHPF